MNDGGSVLWRKRRGPMTVSECDLMIKLHRGGNDRAAQLRAKFCGRNVNPTLTLASVFASARMTLAAAIALACASIHARTSDIHGIHRACGQHIPATATKSATDAANNVFFLVLFLSTSSSFACLFLHHS